MKHNLLYIVLIWLCSTASAQTNHERLYLPYDAQVTVGSRTQAFPWAGGANNPQPSIADLNRDGIPDLILFDEGAGVRTFLNTSSSPGNPKYVYHPEFQINFPKIISYLKLYDYNGDKIPDLFSRGFSGVTPLRGYYNSKNELCFDNNTKFAGFTGLKYMLFGNYAPVSVAPNDMPAFGDIDGDGDMDIITYESSGTNIYYYRNCAKEDGLPLDSIKICVKDLCWGKTAQLNTRNILMGITCGTSGVTCKGCSASSSANKTTHAGNTLCLIDIEGDGDMDVLNGNVSFSDIQFTKNGRVEYGYPIDTMIAVDTIWGAHGKPMFMPQQPTAYYMDFDNDGRKDLAFTPYLQGSENYKCIVYYKNVGTATKPDFIYQSDTLFMQDMIDVGTASAPVFYDYNKDGKPDLFVGGEGLYQPATGTFLTTVFYYENTSSVGSPSFTLKTKDFMSLSGTGIKGAALAMGDLDGDGKDDLVIGSIDGTVAYYHNNATSATVAPVWQNPRTLNDLSGTLDVGDYAAPCIYDIDKDGKKDLVMGSQVGKLTYYRNSGGATAPAYLPLFNKLRDTLGNLFIYEGTSYTFTSPYIGKIDNSGKDYILIGSGTGILYKYDNFQSGSLNTTYTRLDSAYSDIGVYARARPAVADIDGDGRYEMVVGDQVGGLFLFKQFFNVDIADKTLANGGVKIYPNPAKNMINIGWLPAFAASGNVHITLISVTGQKLYDADVDASATNAQVDVSGIANGTYYCIVRSAEQQASSPVSILR